MTLYTLWQWERREESPELLAACDEHTWDAWGRAPAWYQEAVDKYPGAVAVNIIVSDLALERCFVPPPIEGVVVEPDE